MRLEDKPRYLSRLRATNKRKNPLLSVLFEEYRPTRGSFQ